MAVHVVGNVCLDTSFRLDRFPRPGETLNAIDCTVGLGGKGANQALAAARTGVEATLWAAVGRDREARRVRALLREAGLADRGLGEGPAPTDRSSILLDASGENLIVSAVAAARGFAAERSGWLEAARPGDLLLMQNNLAPATTAACLRAARRRGLPTVLNASPLAPSERPALDAVDLVLVNRGEAACLTGCLESEAAAMALLAMGARQAVVTLGAAGVVLARPDAAPSAWPAPVVAAVDTSGAGDVLCGTLAGLLALGHGLVASLRVAIAAAAHAATRVGTFGTGPSRAELSALLAEEPA